MIFCQHYLVYCRYTCTCQTGRTSLRHNRTHIKQERTPDTRKLHLPEAEISIPALRGIYKGLPFNIVEILAEALK